MCTDVLFRVFRLYPSHFIWLLTVQEEAFKQLQAEAVSLRGKLANMVDSKEARFLQVREE